MKTAVLPIACLALLAAPAFAQDTAPSSNAAAPSGQSSSPGQSSSSPRTFQQLDTDGNGRVTEEEYTSGSMDKPFMSYDSNGDGRITEDEYRSKDRNKNTTERMP